MSIPVGVYYDIQRKNFYKDYDTPCGTVFWRTWRHRWNEFPLAHECRPPDEARRGCGKDTGEAGGLPVQPGVPGQSPRTP
jgi:hypothetical protein